MAEYSDIINGVDSSLESFDKEALKAQKRIMEKIQLLAKDLEVDSAGNIKTTIANLKKINSIKAEISRIVCDDRYKEAVTKFCESFQKVYDRQNKYYKEHFAEATLSETAAKKQKLLGQMAIDNTIEGLTGAGVNAQITDKLTDMLKRSVTSGALWTDMVAEMRSYLDPDGDGTGAFAKYAKTYATTAMGQFTGQNNKLMTDALDTEWFMYVGSDIETTREFCQHLTKKKYIHVSEIPEILKGHIDGHDCAIYAKTGLPQGMIEGTTPENFQVNVGGWNCRHQLLPVAEEAVPEDIRRKFQQTQEEQAQTDFEKWMAMHQSFFNQYQKELLLTGNDLQNPRLKSMSMDDLEELFEYSYKVDVKNCQRNINSWKVKIQDVIDEAQKINAADVASEARSLMSKYSLSSLTPDGYDRAENGGFNADYKKLIEKLNDAKNKQAKKEAPKVEEAKKEALLQAIDKAETHLEQIKGDAHAYIHDDKSLSISERAKNYAEALKLYAGRSGDAPELGYSLNLARSGDVRFLATKATKQDPVMVMNLDIINQHAELMGANLASIPTAWRGRFNDLIRRINATDIGEKGYVACKAEIQEAYNIYKLSTNKTAIKYGLEKISTKMPVEVVEKFKKIFDGGKMPDKEFFDMLDTYIPLIPKAVRGQEGYYSPSDKVVVISPTASDKVRLEGSKWFREALFYHEYGHAKDHISIAGKWRTDVRWTTLFDKFARRINQDGGKSIQAAFDKKYEELGGRRNISRNDQEMMGALADTLQAMVSDHRYFDHMGHSRSYFASKDSQLAEFIAHASENRWMGNPYFREIFPDLYQEMIDLCNEMYRR